MPATMANAGVQGSQAASRAAAAAAAGGAGFANTVQSGSLGAAVPQTAGKSLFGS